MLPVIKYKDQTILYMADLVPSSHHIPLPYVMAYDTRPLETLKEKESILKKAAQDDWVLFFEHDPHIECVNLSETEKGVRKNESFALSEL